MDRAIDKIRAASATERRKVEVPEWGLVLWIRRFTVGDIVQVRALAEAPDDQNIHLLTRVAEDEAGQPLFALGDYDILRNQADYRVVQRIVTLMFAETPTSLEAAIRDQRKLIDGDPTPASATT